MPDLPATPTTADPYGDHGAIKALVTRKRTEWAKGREPFIRAAYRNVLFYRGIQWIKWDRTINRWRPARLPRNTPTPVTNVFGSTMDALTSIFARIEPTLNFRPGAEQEPGDRAAADVSIRAIQAVEDEVAIRANRQILAAWVGLTGQAWLETGYDPDPIHGSTFIPYEQCPTCGGTQPAGKPTCQACGQPGLQPAMDEQGQPLGEQVPRGRLYVDVCSIFEMFFDPSIPEWRKQRAYLREKSVSLDEAKARWPNLDSITPNVMETEGWYSDALATVGPMLDENQSGRLAHLGSTRPMNSRVTEQWYWQLPDVTYPDGLLAVIVSRNAVAYAGPLPYSSLGDDGSRIGFLPHVHFPQKVVPGTAFSKTVADDLAVKQMQRNRWESIVESCGMRMGSPVWLKPLGANVTNLTGDPANIISYNAVGPGAAKPERIPGQGIPMSFVHIIEGIDKSFEELAATFDVLKGARPEGVSAGIALQILQERGMSRYGPLFILWEQAWAEWARQALEIFREFATEPRILKIKGRDGAWQVKKFLGADLQGRVDVIPEAASSMPRSSLLDRAEMEQLASLHIIDLNDPEIKWKFLEVYGRTNLTPQMASDTKNAIRENEAFEALARHPVILQATPEDVQAARDLPYMVLQAEMEKRGVKLPRIRPAIDDHVIHLREVKAFAKSEPFEKLPELVQVLIEKHSEFHQQLLQAQAAALQQGGPSLPMAGGAFSQPPANRNQNPMSSGSSPARMEGDMEEMSRSMVSPGA